MVCSSGFVSLVLDGGALMLVYWSVSFVLHCLFASVFVYFYVCVSFFYVRLFCSAVQIVMGLLKAHTMCQVVAIHTLFMRHHCPCKN